MSYPYRQGMPTPVGRGDPLRPVPIASSQGPHARFQSQPQPTYRRPAPVPSPYGAESSYSVNTFTDEEKFDHGYGYHNEEEDEVKPLQGNYAYPPAQAPVRFGTPASSGISRRDTSAAAWQRRQRAPLARAQTKKVKLTNGHFVADFAVPTPVASANGAAFPPGSDPTEFTHLRYTAATCDPDDFVSSQGWSLRASNYGRTTDLLVAITYYNEDKVLMARSLHGIMLNIRDMVKAKWSEFRRNSEKTGEPQPWKRVIVSIIFDGIGPADKAALDVLATIGLYQDALIKNDVDGVKTTAHIFEYTTALSMSPQPSLIQPVAGDPNNLVPVQLIFCLKAENGKKINSHRWLFNGISSHINPETCVLLDAGTKPGKHSIYYLWEAFYHDKDLGGACGEIHAQLKGGKKLINPLVAAQNFEYKMSNILDKPTESAFGYVTVLPGAFSAYRFKAISGRPLQQYFHGDHTLASRLGAKGILGMSIFKKNMFLAEDRILCFELVAKANDKWILGYVKPSKAETDVPESGAELIGQRRRWLNGSFAAGIYALAHFHRLYRSNHNFVRMFFLHVQALYQSYNLFMSWFQVANFWITFTVIINIISSSVREPTAISGATDDVVQCWANSPLGYSGEPPNPHPDILGRVNSILGMLYLALLAFQVILALGNRPKGERLVYNLSFLLFGIFSLYLIVNTIYLTVMAFCPISGIIDEGHEKGESTLQTLLAGQSGFVTIMAGLLGTFGIYIITSIFYLDPWHLFHSMPQFLVIAISFTNILNIYAFCNLHDVSWGTKGSDNAEALPSVQSKKDKNDSEAVAEVSEKVQEDVDSAFESTVKRAIAPFHSEEETEKPTPDDLNKTFRTRFVAVWLLSNAILAIVITRVSANVRTKYFTFILFSTFGLSAVRFLGFTWYMVGETVFRLARLCTRRR